MAGSYAATPHPGELVEPGPATDQSSGRGAPAAQSEIEAPRQAQAPPQPREDDAIRIAPDRPAPAGPELEHRPVAVVRIEGLRQVPEQLVRNTIRVEPGDPFDADVVNDDIVRLTHLDRFARIDARVQQRPDGTLELTYVVEELPLLTDVQVVGNKSIGDSDLLGAALLRAGDAASPYLIANAVQRLQSKYREEGYHFTSIDYDQQLLEETGILLFRVREGPRVRISRIRFIGNEVLHNDELHRQIESRRHFPIIPGIDFRRGDFDEEQINRDVAAIRQLYAEHGYLDAQVGRRIELSPDQQRAEVTFEISEGEQFTVSDISVEGNTIFSDDQLIEAMPMRRGGIYSSLVEVESAEALQAMYQKLGFIRAEVDIQFVYRTDEPKVNALIRVDEGRSYKLGQIQVQGNTITQNRVVYHQLRNLRPGRTFDGTGIEKTRRQLEQSGFFAEPRITVVDNPDDPEHLDLMIELQERRTGSFRIGAGVTSDLGVVGSVEVTQRNFDIASPPESIDEFIRGESFRGAGQFFRLTLQPGTVVSRFRAEFGEPNLFETDFGLRTAGGWSQWDRDDYLEQRGDFTASLSHAFGDVWSATGRFRIENVGVRRISASAPTDVFDVQGSNLILGTALTLERSTVDDPREPGSGSRSFLEVEQVGLGVGDFNFTKLSGGWTHYWTLDTDYLGRKSVLRARTEAGYLFGGTAPLFERFYAGGHRSFRGFEFRGVGPRGIRADTGQRSTEAVGGDFMFLAGLEYSFPVAEEFLRGVLFVDSGTVQQDIGLDKYRVAAGFGFRVRVPMLDAPVAIDFGVPLRKEDGDQTQLISFDLDLPF